MATLNRLNHVWLLLAYFGVFLIVILSLVPGTLRPHTGASGSMEHLAAYTLVATAFSFGSQTQDKPLSMALDSSRSPAFWKSCSIFLRAELQT